MAKTKVLITGAQGQLGQMIQSLLGHTYELFPTDKDNMDITNRKLVDRVVQQIKPAFIIHAAAFTNVDGAEADPVLCNKINYIGTRNVAQSAHKAGACVFYISTDYVFDGKETSPYRETDATKPLSVYGQTKLAGEQALALYCPRHYTLRISWLFGHWSENKNFVETMIALARQNKPLKVVNDQVGSPTLTNDVVQVIDKIIKKEISFGTYHFSGRGQTSKFEQAKEVFKQAKLKVDLSPCTSDEFPTPAKRPKYSYLDTKKIEHALDIKIRPWQVMLSEYLDVDL